MDPAQSQPKDRAGEMPLPRPARPVWFAILLLLLIVGTLLVAITTLSVLGNYNRVGAGLDAIARAGTPSSVVEVNETIRLSTRRLAETSLYLVYAAVLTAAAAGCLAVFIYRRRPSDARTDVSSAAQRAAEEANRRLALHVNNSPLAWCEWDLAGNCVRWNDRASEMFARNGPDELGTEWMDGGHVHPEDRDRVFSAIAPLIRGEADRVVIEHRNIRGDGKVITCLWYNSLIRDSAGHPVCVESLALEVTDRVEALEKLRLESELLRSVSEATPYGIAVIGADGTIQHINGRLREIFHTDRSPDPARALNFADFAVEDLNTGRVLAPEDRPTAQAFRSGRSAPEMLLRVVAPYNIEPVYVAASATPLREGDARRGTVLLVCRELHLSEVPGSPRARQNLRPSDGSRHMLALSVTSNLASNIAHDLGNVMLAVQGSADVLAEAIARGRDTRHALASLSSAIEMGRQTTKYLTLYAPSGEEARAPIDLKAFGDQAAGLMSRLVSHSFRVGASHSGDAVSIMGSRSRLLRAMLVLACDAKGTAQDGRLVTIATSSQRGKALIVSRGVGSVVPAEVALIVREHQGKVTVSDIETDPVLTIELPVVVIAANPGPAPVAPPRDSGERGSGSMDDLDAMLETLGADMRRVTPPSQNQLTSAVPLRGHALLIQSDPMIVPVIVQTLRNAGMTVTSFENADLALAAFRQGPESPAVVIADLAAPGLDGSSAIRRMRKMRPHLPAVMISGEVNAQLPPDLNGSATRLLCRPFSMGSLKMVLSELFTEIRNSPETARFPIDPVQ